MEANLLAVFLESEQIKVELEHQTLAGIMPIGGNLGVRIFVFEPQWERAVKLFKTYEERGTTDSSR